MEEHSSLPTEVLSMQPTQIIFLNFLVYLLKVIPLAAKRCQGTSSSCAIFSNSTKCRFLFYFILQDVKTTTNNKRNGMDFSQQLSMVTLSLLCVCGISSG
jgi:hypothetical protein